MNSKKLIFTFIFFTSCASYNEDLMRVRGDINMLQSQINILQDKNNELNINISKINEAIKSIRENQANTGTKVDDIEGDIQRLTGRFEELKYQFEKSPKLDYEERINSIERELNDIKNMVSSLETGVSEELVLPKEHPNEDSLYKDAYETYKKGDFKSAIEKFKNLKNLSEFG